MFVCPTHQHKSRTLRGETRLTNDFMFCFRTSPASGNTDLPMIRSTAHSITHLLPFVWLAFIGCSVGLFAQEPVASVVQVRMESDEWTLPASSLAKLPLLQKENLTYAGAFRVPKGNFGDSTFSYGGTACAYHQSNHSLFIVGHDHHQSIAEIRIPKLVNSKQVSDLNTAVILQPFANVFSRIPDFTIDGAAKIGGLLVVDGKLLGTAYEFYDADANAADSHFRFSTLDLNKASVEGLFRVGNFGGGFVAGYMTKIPAQWRQPLGMPYLTGQAALAIISRTSYGPAAFGFDPTDLGPVPTPILAYAYYPKQNQTLGFGTGRFNGTTRINGIVFAPQTRSVLFFGSEGTGQIQYGDPKTIHDPYAEGKGYCSRDGKYEYRVWAYDVLDFVACRSGTKRPWDVKPYSVWSFTFPMGPAKFKLGGIAFDSASNRLYMTQLVADVVDYDANPLIHGYDVTLDVGR
jgi:hypothetical protein